jgi:lipid A 3-O-deacylase
LGDWRIGERFLITPSFGAGLYHDGGGKNLGHTIEFRSQLEIGYEFDDKSRIGLAGGHISNAALSDRNPGTEIINLYYHQPIDWNWF